MKDVYPFHQNVTFTYMQVRLITYCIDKRTYISNNLNADPLLRVSPPNLIPTATIKIVEIGARPGNRELSQLE